MSSEEFFFVLTSSLHATKNSHDYFCVSAIKNLSFEKRGCTRVNFTQRVHLQKKKTVFVSHIFVFIFFILSEQGVLGGRREGGGGWGGDDAWS